MKVGYIRVSTDNQSLARQEDIMKALGIERVFSEKASGKNQKRPELMKMMDFVREGDSVYVESISRMARSTRDLLNLVDQMNEKGVFFISDKERFDTSSPQGRFVLTIFSALAELERESILQRQKEGLLAAKNRGVHLGRPKIEKPNGFDEIANKVLQGGMTSVQARKELGLTKTVYYKFLKEKKATVTSLTNE